MKINQIFYYFFALSIFTMDMQTIVQANEYQDIVYASLILQPQAQIQSATQKMKQFITSTSCGILGAIGSYKAIKAYFNAPYDNYSPHHLPNTDDEHIIVGSSIIGALFASISWYFIQHASSEKYKVNATKAFIKNWLTYKKAVPKHLHDIFDYYYSIYQNNPAEFHHHALALATLIEQIYTKKDMHIFEKIKYFFQTRHFTSSLRADVGSTLRGCADVVKSFK